MSSGMRDFVYEEMEKSLADMAKGEFGVIHFSIGKALEVLKDGKMVTRASWTRGAHLCFSSYKSKEGLVRMIKPGKLMIIIGHRYEVWSPTQDDLLADDWMSYEHIKD